jgi:nitroimidazol reductase NimA-like FMN-containing flavoprotein (pyridoxamine 5'-phosphate oxidase superfamily)
VADSAAQTLSVTARTKLNRMREEGRTDRADLHAVLRAGFVAHLGLPGAHGVMVVPTIYGFDDDHVYVHGSVASQTLAAEAEYCLTVTVVDGLVLARSVFEHSVNYRCAMIYAVPRIVTDPDEKLAGLRLVSEHVAPGQWDYARQPSRKELAATRLLAMSLAEASVKIRAGGPDDGDSPDAALGLWAGELPLDTRWRAPVPDATLSADIAPPAHILRREGNEAHPA